MKTERKDRRDKGKEVWREAGNERRQKGYKKKNGRKET